MLGPDDPELELTVSEEAEKASELADVEAYIKDNRDSDVVTFTFDDGVSVRVVTAIEKEAREKWQVRRRGPRILELRKPR